MGLLRNRLRTLSRQISSSSSASSDGATIKVPLLYKSEAINEENEKEAVTLQIQSWGRGASGQQGGGIEEMRLYPSPVANLLLPPSYRFSDSPTAGRLRSPSSSEEMDSKVEVGICCGLFHSGLVVDGKLWIWGKGDGGRLGFDHENPFLCLPLTLIWIRLGLLLWVASIPLPSPLSVTSSLGVMVVLEHLGILFITGNCFLDWWKAIGVGKYGRLQLMGHILLPSRIQVNFILGVEMKGMAYWAAGPNEGGGLSIPSKVKALPVPVLPFPLGVSSRWH